MCPRVPQGTDLSLSPSKAVAKSAERCQRFSGGARSKKSDGGEPLRLVSVYSAVALPGRTPDKNVTESSHREPWTAVRWGSLCFFMMWRAANRSLKREPPEAEVRRGPGDPHHLGGGMDVGLQLGNAWARQKFLWLLASCVRLTQPILNCVILWAVVPRP
jgi:hypothetical protein